MPHLVHECPHCGVVWGCDGSHPRDEFGCVRPYQWECWSCFEAGRWLADARVECDL